MSYLIIKKANAKVQLKDRKKQKQHLLLESFLKCFLC
jgi:hypothetical protein